MTTVLLMRGINEGPEDDKPLYARSLHVTNHISKFVGQGA